MELPPYRLPNLQSIWFHMWQRTRAFLENAWTLSWSSALSSGCSCPFRSTAKAFCRHRRRRQRFAAVAGAMAPALEPLGFGSWQASGALITGFVAKEVVVSTMAQVYGVESVAETGETAYIRGRRGGNRHAASDRPTVDTIKSLPLLVGIDLLRMSEEAPPSDLMTAIRQGFEETSGGYGALAAFSFMVLSSSTPPVWSPSPLKSRNWAPNGCGSASSANLRWPG